MCYIIIVAYEMYSRGLHLTVIKSRNIIFGRQAGRQAGRQ